MTLNHLEVMQELASIRRGVHSGWRGDRVLNAEAFADQIARDMPEEANALADDIEKNLSDYSTETGLTPGYLGLISGILRGDTL